MSGTGRDGFSAGCFDRRSSGVLEAHVLLEEAELHGPGGAVALLGDDDLGGVLVGGVRVVVLVPVEHHDDVRVLFYRPALAKIRHHRSMAFARLHLSA